MSSSSRPMPRRESPWGVTREYHPKLKAHRCNDHVEDVKNSTLGELVPSALSNLGA
ncbi:hypothetical protein JHK85_043443 [Glycine max]|nr:hypothetical protein JHK85_043443 [Glycine max]